MEKHTSRPAHVENARAEVSRTRRYESRLLLAALQDLHQPLVARRRVAWVIPPEMWRSRRSRTTARGQIERSCGYRMKDRQHCRCSTDWSHVGSHAIDNPDSFESERSTNLFAFTRPSGRDRARSGGPEKSRTIISTLRVDMSFHTDPQDVGVPRARDRAAAVRVRSGRDVVVPVVPASRADRVAVPVVRLAARPSRAAPRRSASRAGAESAGDGRRVGRPGRTRSRRRSAGPERHDSKDCSDVCFSARGLALVIAFGVFRNVPVDGLRLDRSVDEERTWTHRK